MLVWQLEVDKFGYKEKKNWLAVNDQIEPFDYIDDDKDEKYTIYFADFKSMSKHIDEITEGYRQYWADSYERTDGREEMLEYHNGSEWDAEIHLGTKQVRIDESMIAAINKLK